MPTVTSANFVFKSRIACFRTASLTMTVKWVQVNFHFTYWTMVTGR